VASIGVVMGALSVSVVDVRLAVFEAWTWAVFEACVAFIGILLSWACVADSVFAACVAFIGVSLSWVRVASDLWDVRLDIGFVPAWAWLSVFGLGTDINIRVSCRPGGYRRRHQTN
jgi:hypothetical protein